MNPITLPSIMAKQQGRILYICKIPAAILSDLYNQGTIAVDVWSSTHQEGYQRQPVITRARKFAKFIANNGISPTSILLYQRDTSNGVIFKDNSLVIPNAGKTDKPLLYLVDGQHRTLGIAEGYSQDYFKKDTELEFPVTILVTDGEIDPIIEEATQFVTINTEQKRVRTDLASQQLLKIRSTLHGSITKETRLEIGTKKELKPFATSITNFLAEDEDSPWFGKIVRPNTTRAPSGLPSQGQFEDSLMDGYIGDSVIEYGASAGYTIAELLEVIKNYWRAIFILMPDSINTPENYYVTKTLGIHSLNSLLPSIFHIKRLNKIPTKTEFEKILTKLDAFTEEFWISGGEAGSYGGGKAAFSSLTKEIHKRMLN
ncbi:MAG: DGQHR domain-containing protein [Calditrichaeota bacterium]|nr:DGQHR domain-containing protein [Calditrichota bacterium]